jgi:hypothetical protein
MTDTARQAGEMDEHPVERFRRQLEQFESYPPGVVAVPSYLPGTAFFAASAGLYRPAASTRLPDFPYGGCMFIGHNLDSETSFRRDSCSQQQSRVPAGSHASLRNRLMAPLNVSASANSATSFIPNEWPRHSAGPCCV